MEQFYHPLLHTLIKSLNERFNSLKSIHALQISSASQRIRADLATNLSGLRKIPNRQETGIKDIDGAELFDEIKALLPCINDVRGINDPETALNHLVEYEYADYCSNLVIVLRIYLALPVSFASAESSFSKLKLVKNYLRSTLCAESLNSYAIMSIEKEIANSMSYDTVINKFASMKARKAPLSSHWQNTLVDLNC